MSCIDVFIAPYLVFHASCGTYLCGHGFFARRDDLVRSHAAFGLSLGKIMSSVLLSVVYLVIVLPVAALRRLMGKDSLRLRQWRSGSESCFIVREHSYTAEGLKHPY